MSHYKANGELKKTAPDYFTITPDVDNVTKFVLDALQPAVLKDDKFVVLCLWVREVFACLMFTTEQLFTFRKNIATTRGTRRCRLSWWYWTYNSNQ